MYVISLDDNKLSIYLHNSQKPQWEGGGSSRDVIYCG